jgi:hypothetical protein
MDPAATGGRERSPRTNALVLRTQHGILCATEARGLVEATESAPRIIFACLPVAQQFQLFTRLLASLGTSLQAQAETLGIQSSEIGNEYVLSIGEEKTSSFLMIIAEWRGTTFTRCMMSLDARLENNRGTAPQLKCELRQKKSEGDMQFRYCFSETYAKTTAWKDLTEESSEGDVWNVIGRAMEDLFSPGHYPRLRVHLGGVLDAGAGTLSMELVEP